MRVLSVVSLMACAVFGVACSQQPPDEPPDAGQHRTCVGGVITADGRCEAKCDPSKCVANNTCVDNRCQLKCTAHSQCLPYIQSCLPAVEDDTGAAIFTCQNVPLKEYGDPCPNGNECGSNYCVWSGPGDTHAYCTVGCNTDTDCPGGYECGVVRDPHEVCGSDPKKGNNGFCGTTDEACVNPDTPDSGYVESSFCLEKKICLKRDVCATCESDVDCSWSGTKCVTIEGEKRCASACTQDSDCERDKQCTNGYCTPKYGPCTGATGGFCEPCRYDTDCAPGMACAQLHGNERACVDPTLSQPCSSDEDCPTAPSGKHAICLDGRMNVPSNSSVYHHCYLAPFDPQSNVSSCW